MRYGWLIWLLAVVIGAIWSWQSQAVILAPKEPNREPSEYFLGQHAYPFEDINYGVVSNARKQMLAFKQQQKKYLVPWESLGPTRVTESYYGADGAFLEARQRDPFAGPGKITLLMDTENAQELPDGAAWVEVTADQNLIGYDLFGASAASGNDFFAGLQGAYATSKSLVYPHFQASETQWLGLTAVNTSSGPAGLKLELFDSEGHVLEAKSLEQIPAKGKESLLVGSFFTSPDALEKGAWVRARGESAIWNGFLLWGDHGAGKRRHMSGMVAVPMEN